VNHHTCCLQVHLDCRIGCCEFEHLPLNQLEKQTSNEKFMAIAVNFEPVEEIHIGGTFEDLMSTALRSFLTQFYIQIFGSQ